jgi:glutamate N-acetyltransferase / amino-acid N-acetyltransferase
VAVGLKSLPILHPVRGVALGATAAGIRRAGRLDLVVMELSPGTAGAAVFTCNAFRAAPVVVAEEHLHRASPRYLLINTGCANAGTGARGLEDTRECCAMLGEMSGCRAEEVLPFSTGVIGELLPVDRIRSGLPDALARLSPTGWIDAATAIMTTDTVPKAASVQVEMSGQTVTITGIAKGAGMIRPDMATMLAFIATDADVPRKVLHHCLQEAVAVSFNRITVDGDTSTNDACVLAATGQTAATVESTGDPGYVVLRDAVSQVAMNLAKAIVRDGEGATRFITVEVREGRTVQECDQAAYAIAQSPLVKTAFFAGDPNWGRILAAVGRAGLPELDIERVRIDLDEVCIVQRGGRASSYREDLGAAVMSRPEITVRVALGRGGASTRVWTCDLSYDYVRINAEYRT